MNPVGVYDWVCHTFQRLWEASKASKPPSAGLEESHHVMALLLGSWALETPMVSTLVTVDVLNQLHRLMMNNVTYSTHLKKLYWTTLSHHYWLVVWNIWIIFPYVGNDIMPTNELIFFRGVGIPPTSISQSSSIFYWYFPLFQPSISSIYRWG